MQHSRYSPPRSVCSDKNKRTCTSHVLQTMSSHWFPVPTLSRRCFGENWRAGSDQLPVDHGDHSPVPSHHGVWQRALQNGTLTRLCFEQISPVVWLSEGWKQSTLHTAIQYYLYVDWWKAKSLISSFSMWDNLSFRLPPSSSRRFSWMTRGWHTSVKLMSASPTLLWFLWVGSFWTISM